MAFVGPQSHAEERQPQLSPQPAGARFALREATAGAHGRVDALFSRFDLGTRTGYAAFLSAQAGAHLAVEDALDGAGAGRVIGDWPERRRAADLRRDLAELGVALPATVPPPCFVDDAEILGGLYVLEGSRLGGALLKRAVPDAFPSAFLTPGTSGGWRAFVTVLDASLTTPDLIDRAVAAALAAFLAFERSAEIALETPAS